MSIGDISLTAGMRNNLVALQSTATLVASTQAHLSTGKKVNTALDNPIEFFASQSMLNQANALASYKDGMSNAVQTVQAANEGITGIESLVQQAKSLAQSALGTSDKTAQDNLHTQYTAVLGEITLMAGDSGFQGTNLLKAGSSLAVTFSSSDTLTVSGAGADATTLAIGAGTSASTTGWTDASTCSTTLDTAMGKLQSQSQTLSSSLSIINARQSFSTNMINVLQTGSDNLTLADTNQEGANMLMLQTRQSLGTTALSLASQSAQAVLKLFG